MSTRASRSGAQYARTVSTTRWSNGKPPWMIGARSGHAHARQRRRAGRPRERALVGAARHRRRRGEQPDAARCASPPPPARLRAARRRSRRRRASSPSSAAAARAAPRPSPSCRRPRAACPAREQLLGDLERERLELRRRARRRTGSARCRRGRRSPRAAAATSSSCSTVSPPTPESKTPIGRRRSSSGGARAATPPVWHACRTDGPERAAGYLADRRRSPSLSFSTIALAMPLSERCRSP